VTTDSRRRDEPSGRPARQAILRGVAGKARFFHALVTSKIMRRTPPLFLYWFVTNRCNFRCSYCYGSFHSDQSPDLPTEVMLQMIDEMSHAGVKRVNLLGGEPLMRTDLGVLVDRLVSRKISVCVLTNGSLLGQHFEEIEQVDEVGLSIDGCEEIHDAIRGRGAFRALTRAIASLREKRITVVLTYSMVVGNIQELDFVMEFARRQGVYVTVNVAHGRVFGTEDVPVTRASNDAYRAALQQIIKYHERGYPVFRARRTLELMLRWKDYHEDTSEIPPTRDYPRCSFGSYAATLTSDGTLIPCFLNSRGSAGLSVPEHGFSRAWQHCRQMAHCTYCHVPCFIEYNSILDLSLPVLLNAGMNLCVRPLFAKPRDLEAR